MRTVVLVGVVAVLVALGQVAAQEKDEAKERRDHVFGAVNKLRKDSYRADDPDKKPLNLPALKRDAKLDAIAQAYAEEMVRTGKRSEDSFIVRIEGTELLESVVKKLRATGFKGEAAANVGARYPGLSKTDVATFWAEHPPSFAIILDEKWTETGIGVAKGPPAKFAPEGGPSWHYCQIYAAPKK